MSKAMRRLTASALVALIALAGLLAMAGSALAQSVPDTLVTGTITGATSGQVSVNVGGTACTKIAGGTVAADGTYQIVVNCAAGAGQVLLNAVAVTGATFTLVPGVPVTASGTIAAPTPPPATPTPAPPVATPTPAVRPPATGNTAPAGSSSSAWLLVAAGLGALALGVGGVAAVRKAR
jgi:hypothetical protein